MVDIPPGIIYLAQGLPKLAAPPILTYLAYLLAEPHLENEVPTWLLRSLVALSLPVALTVKVQWQVLKIKWEARRHGAVLPPFAPDPLPGGLSFLLAFAKGGQNEYPGDKVSQAFKNLGNTFNVRVFFENRAVLATQFDDFEKGPEQRRRLSPLLGTGVFAADGELWKFHRAMTRPFFTKDRISHFDLFDRHGEDAINQMKTRFKAGIPVDFQDVIARFTLDAATEFLLGNSVKSLSEGLPYPLNYAGEKTKLPDTSGRLTTQFVKSFTAAQEITSFRIRFGDHWPLASFWRDELKDHMRVVHAFIDPIVAAAIDKKKRSTIVVEKDEETLLENLVNSTEDPIILRDEVMNLLVAGRDTTACLLTYTIYMLAEHPDILRRLRKEILTSIGPDRKPTYADLREMKYLRAVLNGEFIFQIHINHILTLKAETLRLYPPVPFNIRLSKSSTLLPSKVPGGKPYYVPSGIRVPYSIITMHRREDLWGPDALEFDPDRFIDERLQKHLTPNPFIFLPFNAGPRICLGQQFAYHEASFFLVRLLQNFATIALAPEAQPPASRPPSEWATSENPRIRQEKVKPKAHLTMYIEGGLWTTMEEASHV